MRDAIKTLSLVTSIVVALSLPNLSAAQELEDLPPQITLPAGTRVVVRTAEPMASDKNKAGDRFTAVLEGGLSLGDQVVVPSGTLIYGRVKDAEKAGRVRGRAKLVLELTDIMLAGQLIPIITDFISMEGDRSGAVRTTGTAALIGAGVDGGSGAKTGALVGGAASLLTPGKQIGIPPQTILEFRSQQPTLLPTSAVVAHMQALQQGTAQQQRPQNAVVAPSQPPSAPEQEPAATPLVVPQTQPAPAGAVTLPAGTRIVAKTAQPVTSDLNDTGDRFTLTLEGALVVNGQTVAASGAVLYGRVNEAEAARRVRGQAKLVLELTDIKLGGQLIPIISDVIALEGDRSGTVKNTGGAALIGAVAGGISGAAIGAAIGGGLSLLTPGKQIRIPAETIFEFRTQQPVTVQG